MYGVPWACLPVVRRVYVFVVNVGIGVVEHLVLVLHDVPAMGGQ